MVLLRPADRRQRYIGAGGHLQQRPTAPAQLRRPRQRHQARLGNTTAEQRVAFLREGVRDPCGPDSRSQHDHGALRGHEWPRSHAGIRRSPRETLSSAVARRAMAGQGYCAAGHVAASIFMLVALKFGVRSSLVGVPAIWPVTSTWWLRCFCSSASAIPSTSYMFASANPDTLLLGAILTSVRM